MEKTASLGAAARCQVAPSNQASTTAQTRSTWFTSIANTPVADRACNPSAPTHYPTQHDVTATSLRSTSSLEADTDADVFVAQCSLGAATSTELETSFTEAHGDAAIRRPTPDPGPELIISADDQDAPAPPRLDASAPLIASPPPATAPRPWELFRAAARRLELVLVNAEISGRSPLKQLESLMRKNGNGEFDLGQKVQYLLTFGLNELQPLGMDLNVAYLKTVRELARVAGPGGADMAAQLLRSPQSSKSWFIKGMFVMSPGYYRTVLEHVEDFPELGHALKSLVDDLAQQDQPVVARRIAKIQKYLAQQFAPPGEAESPSANFTEIRQEIEVLQSRNLELAGIRPGRPTYPRSYMRS